MKILIFIRSIFLFWLMLSPMQGTFTHAEESHCRDNTHVQTLPATSVTQISGQFLNSSNGKQRWVKFRKPNEKAVPVVAAAQKETEFYLWLWHLKTIKLLI